MDMPLWVLLAVFVVIALAAPRYGVDSRRLRPGEPPPPEHRRPRLRDDLRSVVRVARGLLN